MPLCQFPVVQTSVPLASPDGLPIEATRKTLDSFPYPGNCWQLGVEGQDKSKTFQIEEQNPAAPNLDLMAVPLESFQGIRGLSNRIVGLKGLQVRDPHQAKATWPYLTH